MEIFILAYNDSMYPEDNKIIGAFMTEKEAEEMKTQVVKDAQKYWPAGNHHRNEYNYDISEVFTFGSLYEKLSD